MKKTITILGALAIAGSPALASSVVPYKTQNFQNILQPTKAQSNVTNDIISQSVSSDYFYFQARLSASTYNGFTGFINQIDFPGKKPINWAICLFQWLDDNDFHNSVFPNLNNYTAHGYWHEPITWSNRLEEHMGHFGDWLEDKSQTAYNMIQGTDEYYLINFGNTVETAYKQAYKAGNATGIDMNFGFTYNGDTYTVKQPNYVILTN